MAQVKSFAELCQLEGLLDRGWNKYLLAHFFVDLEVSDVGNKDPNAIFDNDQSLSSSLNINHTD